MRRRYKPLEGQRLPTHVDGNKLYILIDPKDDVTKTYWHFKNMDVIFPNLFGLDIHNYSDEIVEYDRRKVGELIIIGKTVRFFAKKSDYNYYFNYNYSKNYITNFTQINDNNITFYLLNPFIENDQRVYKISSIKIPKYMIQLSLSIQFRGAENIIDLDFHTEGIDPILVRLSRPKTQFDIDLGNYDECNKLIFEEDKTNYARLFLSGI